MEGDLDDPETLMEAYEFAGPDDSDFEAHEQMLELDTEHDTDTDSEQETGESYGIGDPLDNAHSWSYHFQAVPLFDQIGAYLTLRSEAATQPGLRAGEFAGHLISAYLQESGWTERMPLWGRAVVQMAEELEATWPAWVEQREAQARIESRAQSEGVQDIGF